MRALFFCEEVTEPTSTSKFYMTTKQIESLHFNDITTTVRLQIYQLKASKLSGSEEQFEGDFGEHMGNKGVTKVQHKLNFLQGED